MNCSDSLIEKISQKFDDGNKVVETKFNVCGVDFSLFYIESLIDKALFTSGLLSPLEKFVKQNSEKKSGRTRKLSGGYGFPPRLL